jgi:hypothetical protein
MDLGTSLCITAAALSVLAFAFWIRGAGRSHARAVARVDSHLEARRRAMAVRLMEERRR